MGGTFDPIHHGHLFVAEEARVFYRLDRILFLPNGHPPHKRVYELTPAEHRFAMTQVAIRSNPDFECSDLEVNRTGASYTVDSLTALREQEPTADLFYITGVDAVADILTWRRHSEVIRLAHFIAATRPGYALAELKRRLPPDYLDRILLIGTTALGISSTELRHRVSRGLPIRYLTPDGVVDYINEHRLYTGHGGEALLPAEQGEIA